MTGALLTVGQVAALVQLDETTVRRAIRRGDLAACKPCGQLRVDRAAVERWLDDTRVRPARPVARAPAPRAPRPSEPRRSNGPPASTFKERAHRAA